MASEANTGSLVTNLNVDPYYDDFNETKNFHRILFRPGQAVQARELTQMQTMLQNQIDRFGEHIFKEGSPVRGCEIILDNGYQYVKLRNLQSNGTTAANVYQFQSKTVKGGTSGVLARVIRVNDGAEANTPNFKTLFVKYVSANTTTGYKTFANNEILSVVSNTAITANSIAVSAVGTGSAVKVGAGVLFAKDHFIRVAEQEIVLDKYSNSPSYKVGFEIAETIVTSVDDSTLLDPAQGSYNYAAPGANRLKLVPTLTKRTPTETVSNSFVQFSSIKNGVIESRSDTPQYAAIRDYMAKRTAEESGNYIVKGLQPRVREHLLSGNNQGVYTSGQGGNTQQIVVAVEPGKAYIEGYDNEFLVTKNLTTDKGIDFEDINDGSIYADYGNYVTVHNVVGVWDADFQGQITLRSTVHGSVANATFSTTDFSGVSIGTARARGIEYVSGIPGSASAQYRIYLTDIKITTAGKSFGDVESIAFNAGTGYANGKADIYGTSTVTDTAANRVVFALPARAIRRLRDGSNNVDINYTIQKEFDFSFGSTGQGTITSTEGSETFTGSGVLGDTTARENFYVVIDESANTSTLTGTISLSGNTVTGSGTAFTTQLNVGDVISTTGSDAYVVSEIASTTSAKVHGSGHSASGAYHKRLIKGQVLDMGGVGRDGDRSINVTSATGVTFDINEALNSPSSITATVVARMQKADTQEATKSVNRNRLIRVHTSAAASGTQYAGNTSGPWPLGLSDGFRLVSVRKKASAFSSTTDGTDVTSHFTLDTGMRDNKYDHARLVKKSTSGLTISSGDQILVTVDYFTHSNRDRGFFGVGSYPVDDTSPTGANIATYEIPVFTSTIDGKTFDLRDSIDFRPRTTDTANSVTALTNISTNPVLSNALDQPSGGLKFPPAGTTFTTDLSYYLPRNDLITVSKDGNMEIVRGVSSLKPKTPTQPSDKMSIGVVTIVPYPSLPDELARRYNRPDYANSLRTIKNERFTMRDIGVIRDRVERLEYYTALSFLEKQAKDTQIQDSNGNDRFKNGFLVDSFTGHNVGNVFDTDYKISIDSAKREARPTFKLDNIEMFYHGANSTNVVRTNVTNAGVSRDQVVTVNGGTFSNGETLTSGSFTATLRWQVGTKLYIENATGDFVASATVTGGTSGTANTIASVTTTVPGRVITLPYSHEIVLDQPYATTTRNTAGLLYSWKGKVSLSPSDDYWVDTVNQPEVQVNIDNNSDNWQYLVDSWPTQWGSWEVVATGAQIAVGAAITTTEEDEWGGFEWSQTTSTQNYTQSVTSQQIGQTIGLTTTQQTQSLGSVVRDVNIQPFMRSRVIKFTGAGLKPAARVYAFFDDVDVSNYITPTNSSFANTANEGSALTTDSNGNVYGEFRIPNNDQIRFRIGEKIFRLTDSITNSDEQGSVTTSAETVYAAQGLTTTAQEITLGTTHVDIGPATVTRTETSQQNFSIVTPGGWTRGGRSRRDRDDPIAQTFQVDMSSIGNITSTSAFLTKLDLFFATKDSRLPVTVEIREVDPASSYPTQIVLAHGRVTINSADVNVSADGTAATPVYFNSPVHLQDGKQYAVVVIPGGGNPNYSVWIARLGDNDIKTGERVTQSPAAGMLFASSNDRTFTALQEEDLKFNLYFANFTVSSTGTVVLKNEDKDYCTVANLTGAFIKAGEVIHGETYLKGVFAPGNGLVGNVASSNSFVQGMVSGATGIITYISSANNEVRVRTVSTGAKFKGGEAVRFRLGASATASPITGNSTGAIHSATYPVGKVSYYNNKGADTYLHIANVSFANSGPAAANNRTFGTNRWIRGQANGYVARIVSLDSLNMDLMNFKADHILPTNTSVTITGKFATSTSARDSSFIKINTNGDTEFSSRRYIHSYSAEANTNLTSASMKDGSSEIKLSFVSNNRYASPVFDVNRVSMSTVENVITSSASGEANVASGGSTSAARYITRKVTLAEGQDAEDLKVFLDAYIPSGSAVNVYYKVLNSEDSDGFATGRWFAMSQDTATTVASSSENRNDFKELEFSVPAYPTGAGTYHSGLYANTTFAGVANVLHYRNSNQALFHGFKYFAIKIVLTGTNTGNVPRIRDLRAIALQK